MLALVHEILAHGTAGVGRDILQRRQLGSRGRHHDGVAHGPRLGEALDEVCHGRALLADGDVDEISRSCFANMRRKMDSLSIVCMWMKIILDLIINVLLFAA